jgi:hypothetical protein
MLVGGKMERVGEETAVSHCTESQIEKSSHSVSHTEFQFVRYLIIIAFNSALKCIIRKVQENQVGLKLNGTHLLLVYADDVNLL